MVFTTSSLQTSLKASVLSSVAFTALSVAAPSYVAAQEQDSVVTENILITARNRAESIQDVPLAVTAFDAEKIARKNIQDLDDIARFTAGFSFEDFDGGNANPGIRGQSTLRQTGREQTVATFVDGIYMPRSWLVDLGAQNFQRLEIVKGPQSARYGRNAFAGAINYVGARPSDEFAVDANLTVGSDERLDFGGAISMPLVEDKLAVRLAYSQTEFDGAWENSHPNADVGFDIGTNGNIGGWDNQSYSAIAVFTPVDELRIEASYMGFEFSEEGRAARWLNTGQGQGNCGSLQVGGNPSLFCGIFPEPGEQAVLDPRGFGRQADIDIFRISAEYDVTDEVTVFYQFGKTDANTITANTAESDPVNCGTILGPPVFPDLCNFQGSPIGSVDYGQHELRLTYDDGEMLRVAGGVFYMNGDDRPVSISRNLPPLGTEFVPVDIENSTSFPDFSNFIFRRELTNTESFSVFAEATYAFNGGRTRIGAEGRYTSEKIITEDLRSMTVVGDETFNFFTPRVTAEHDLTDDTLLYATVARGAKAGGFNTGFISPELATFDPEFNWTYEVGAKNTFLDGAATVNFSAFYTDWSSLQISIIDPLALDFTTAATANLGDARIIGLELEGAYQATENISFDFAMSYTNAKYSDGTTDSRFSEGQQPTTGEGGEIIPANFPPPCDDTVCASDGEIGGNFLERSPEWQLALGAQWEKDISVDLSYYVRADVSYQSSHFADSINVGEAPGRTLVNARLGFDYKENFRISFWARNLFDKRFISNSLQITQSGGSNIIGTYFGERRTFGLTANVSY